MLHTVREWKIDGTYSPTCLVESRVDCIVFVILIDRPLHFAIDGEVLVRDEVEKLMRKDRKFNSTGGIR